MTSPILPGARIGVLGSGQLGRMFAMAARRMGYLVHTYSPETGTPTGQVADVEVTAEYENLDAVREFAQSVQVVTFEFENIPSETADCVEAIVPVRPSGHILHTTQHRIREKTFLSRAGYPVTPFTPIYSTADLASGLNKAGAPAILKTAGFGYDGKGQARVGSLAEAEVAFQALGDKEAILEKFIEFQCEISMVGARGLDGQMIAYGPIYNVHRNHILDFSVSPASIKGSIALQARDILFSLLSELEVTGVLCVEFFVTAEGSLYINELAPRPHNSGHYTIDACTTSQFEQQLRAVCGLPLGSTEQPRPAAMSNLLGELWQGGDPDFSAACSYPGVKLHLYGKRNARPGRKMGHLTALADTGAEALESVRSARSAMTPKAIPAV